MFIILWRFVVRPEQLDAFVEHYNDDGSWVRLFRAGAGYHGTELIRSTSEPAAFITIDRWDSLESFEQFKREHRDEYDRLDRLCESLTVQEELLGRYETTDG